MTSRRRRPTPPGPRARHPLGSLPAFRRDVLGFFRGIADEYGDVAGFRLGPHRCCLVNEPSLIEEVLVTHDAVMRKHWSLRQLRYVLGRGLLINEGESWRRQRRTIQPGFHKSRILGYAEIMTRRAAELSGRWRDGEVRDVYADMLDLALDIVTEALCGAPLAGRARSVTSALDRVMGRFETLLTGGLALPLAVPTPANLRTRAALAELDRVIEELIDLRRAQPAGDDLLGWLIEARDEGGEEWSDRQLRDEVVTLLMAGHETTAIALAWTFHLLSRHPEVAARLRDGIASALDEGAPDADSIERIPALRHVVQESMRLYPPAWAIGRENQAEVELGGYRIDGGTQIFLVAWVTQRDARYFDDPVAFRPDRWAGDRKPPKYAYFPFGAGPRYCVGSSFAMMETTLLLATLARDWRFEPLSEEPPEPQATVTLRPRHGIQLRLRRTRDEADDR